MKKSNDGVLHVAKISAIRTSYEISEKALRMMKIVLDSKYTTENYERFLGGVQKALSSDITPDASRAIFEEMIELLQHKIFLSTPTFAHQMGSMLTLSCLEGIKPYTGDEYEIIHGDGTMVIKTNESYRKFNPGEKIRFIDKDGVEKFYRVEIEFYEPPFNIIKAEEIVK